MYHNFKNIPKIQELSVNTLRCFQQSFSSLFVLLLSLSFIQDVQDILSNFSFFRTPKLKETFSS